MAPEKKSILSRIVPALITCFAAGTVLAILAPYGTSNFSILHRLLFWVSLCIAGGLGAGLTDLIASAANRKLKPVPRTFLQSITASIIVALVLWLLNNVYFGSVGLKQFLITLFYIWVISITISTFGAMASSRPVQKETSSSRPVIFDRMPMKLKKSELYAMTAEDHYVRFITSNGEAMILMRLSDAIKETTPLEGLSPHRSWWVGEVGVEQLIKSNGKTEIELLSGHKVPVSRNKLALVRKTGWR